MNDLQNILEKLPDCLRKPLESLPSSTLSSLEEIRIQLHNPVRVRYKNSEIVINPAEGRQITRELMDIILNNLLNYSIYAYEEDLAKGYLTIEGGHRVGVCGRAVIEKGNITLLKDISSLNIRRGREIKGVASRVLNHIKDSTIGLQNTVIVSPPKCGKTTLLRDIARVLSQSGLQVAICDERSEIAGMYQGMPSFDLGPRTDVLDGCPKAEGMIMLIRSMAPDVIITDEIGKEEDIKAIETAVSAGVKIITTIHGNTYEDLMNSRLAPLVDKKLFTRIIFMSNVPQTGTVSEVRCV